MYERRRIHLLCIALIVKLFNLLMLMQPLISKTLTNTQKLL